MWIFCFRITWCVLIGFHIYERGKKVLGGCGWFVVSFLFFGIGNKEILLLVESDQILIRGEQAVCQDKK